MSLRTTCDGPGCERQMPAHLDDDQAKPVSPQWLRLHRVRAGLDDTLDFHDLTCLSQWIYCETTPDACK